jgi:signal transduction histidine kinase
MSDVLLRIADPAVGVVLAGCGSVLWMRRRRSLVGPLMLAAAGCWFLGSIWIVAVFLHRGPLVHLHISYPTGRMRRSLAIVTVICAYAASIVEAIGANPWVTLAMAVLVAVAAADIYAHTSGPARKAGGPALGAALTFASVLALSSANQLLTWENDRLVLLLYDLAICVVAVVLAGDLLWGRWTDATVADFVTQVGARPDLHTLAGALQHALGDPSVELVYWLPDQHRYVDDAGQPTEMPLDDSSRVVVRVEEHGEPVAVLIKDRAVHQDERLLADVTAALRLALGNARLRAQVRANITELGIARRRLVEAADGQRRQLESELDGGPQRRLSEMSRLLETVDAKVEGGLRERLTPMLAELATAQAELRNLAHGIRPPALESGGLAAALPLLVRKAQPDPVDLTVPGRRLPPAVEGAVYFVCAEALTNIAKHANATRASVAITIDHGAVLARIVDNGSGGADRNGSGLRGLADRVEALGGRLSVRDRGEGGTELMARIPLEEAQ